MSSSDKEMPLYNCHKQVRALKIEAITLDITKANTENRETDGSAIITPVEFGYAPFTVDEGYLRKHSPEVGGYYVKYEDGYASYSPGKAFEEGYTAA